MTHSLNKLSTFRINASAQEIITIDTLEDITTLIESNTLQDYNKHMILGGGSNVVFTQDFDGIILLNHLLGKDILSKNNNTLTIKIASGENRDDLVHRSIDNNLSGIENLVMIPGTVGGAPVQNIGAYGAELRDVLVEVEGIDLQTGETLTYNNEECDFGYRDSIFKHTLGQNFFITSITLLLHKVNGNYKPQTHYTDVETVLAVQGWDGETALHPKDIAQAVSYLRDKKLPHPDNIGTVGSFFKNPIIPTQEFDIMKDKFPQLRGFAYQHGLTKLSAGQLIDVCGLKGYRLGDVGVYQQHALVLVNHGSKTDGDELVQLIDKIQSTVYKKFNLKLTPEVNVL